MNNVWGLWGVGQKKTHTQHKADNRMMATSALGMNWQDQNYVKKLGHCEKGILTPNVRLLRREKS